MQSVTIKRPDTATINLVGDQRQSWRFNWHSLQVNWPFMVNLVRRKPDYRRWKRPFRPSGDRLVDFAFVSWWTRCVPSIVGTNSISGSSLASFSVALARAWRADRNDSRMRSRRVLISRSLLTSVRINGSWPEGGMEAGEGGRGRGGVGAADLRIVTVVTMIAAANEVRGWNADWRKTLPGADEGETRGRARFRFESSVLSCSCAFRRADLFSRVIKRALMNGPRF